LTGAFWTFKWTTDKPWFPESESQMADNAPRYHLHHAEAFVLQADLKLPLAQKVAPHTHCQLIETGGYLSQHSENYRLGGVFSFRSARTHVAGNLDDKPGHGWNTLSTCVVEGLNVMEVLTADRIVTQISTDHPPEGYVPRVTFLGTRFENLCIAGKPIEIDIDVNMLGPKPADDAPYSSDGAFLSRVSAQHKTLQTRPDILRSYNQVPTSSTNPESSKCSLVNQVKGSYPGSSIGHVIEVPDFGKIHLAVLHVEQADFENGIPKETTISLNMIKLEMGCVVSGSGDVGGGKTNGTTRP
jgi:hypothetical protein